MKTVRLGFAGIGWIGLSRLRSIVESGVAEVAAIFDIDGQRRQLACDTARSAQPAGSFEAMLDRDLDGVVIATPNSMHERQALAALERGLAVFCEKPLALDAAGAERIVSAARANDRPLAVDFCYRYTAGIVAIKALLEKNQLGEVHAAELAFHNSYGPDREWYYDVALAGGGCVIDLGIHLVDLAFWLLDEFSAHNLAARVHRPGSKGGSAPEDYASIQFSTPGGAAVTIVCSWGLPMAGDARISVGIYGCDGAAEFSNVSGSFYDFCATHITERRAETLASPPDDWSGRAILDWIGKLRSDAGFDRGAEHSIEVAKVIDQVYRQ